MTHRQESAYGEQVRPSVHQDEEEQPGSVEGGELWVVLHHIVEEDGNLLHQDGVKRDKKLDDVRQTVRLREDPLYCRQRPNIEVLNISTTTVLISPDNGPVHISAREDFCHLYQYPQYECGQLRLVHDGRT